MKAFLIHRRISKFFVTYTAVLLLFASCGAYVAERTGALHKWFSPPHRFVQGHAYYDLPRVMVSFDDGGQSTKLRLDMSLEVARADIDKVSGFQVRITDTINKFLSQVQRDEIVKPDSSVWLRKKMLQSVNNGGIPVTVNDLIFREFLLM